MYRQHNREQQKKMCLCVNLETSKIDNKYNVTRRHEEETAVLCTRIFIFSMEVEMEFTR